MGLLYVKTADGKKKPSVWVWLFLLAIILGGSVFLVTNTRETGLDEMMGTTKAKQEANAPIPIRTSETEKTSGELDAEAVNSMQEQIEREKAENGGWIDPQREDEIKRKFADDYKRRQSENFNPSVEERLADFKEPAPTPTPAPAPSTDVSRRSKKYMTLSERLKSEGIAGGSGGGRTGSSEFAIPSNIATMKKEEDDKRKGIEPETGPKKMANLLPMGTFIPCVLESDIVTTDLTSYVWATVVLDVTFRRQLQLPKGLVKLRGKTASEPVQNMVDIYFDVMLFSDGTELPISGAAYAAFDPRYPQRFKILGVPGEMIVPPMYVKLQSLLYSAVLGASDAYIQNYINENTSIPSTFTTVPTINPITGQIQSVIQQQQGMPVNSRIGETVGLSAGQAALEDLVKEAKKDLEKYRPYVVVEKGTPIFVQLDETVDVGLRRVNGVAQARSEAVSAGKAQPKPVFPTAQEVYPPGDARSKYSGSQNGPNEGGLSPGIATSANSFLNQLQSTGTGTQSRLQDAEARLQAAQSRANQGNLNTQELQQVLQNMGGN